MTTSRLPDHEQRILDEMERALRRDRRLERRMRTLRPRRPSVLSRLAHWRPPTLIVALLVGVSTGLMVTGIRTSDPGVIWAFAAVWPPTLYSVFRLLCRWTDG
ncbi:DUF3040 domain-containing protein [Streptomyces sp. V4I2]|uniref:DUF3040 domain-containing protein n=1 Tax=Streptomyces sp. V4I2 TaxID=3042280 RepID=UPI00277F8D9D|nr:DUF3040 domain-containing protein [Streptomyces sp. V4I2]MDQ1049631.1 hypothetical protein [Streptomyces sp. V4I2]